jgi:hypothetical protein
MLGVPATDGPFAEVSSGIKFLPKSDWPNDSSSTIVWAGLERKIDVYWNTYCNCYPI